MIALHAVARGDDAEVAAAAADLGLEAYVDHGVAVLHRVVEAAPSPETAAVLELGSLVRALADAGPILPLRFGSVVDDVEALAALAAERADDWVALLRDLDGSSELIVHLPPGRPMPVVAAPPDGPGDHSAAGAAQESGRAYLTARAAEVHAEEERLAQLRALHAVRAARPLPRDRVSVLVSDPAAARCQVEGWAREQHLDGIQVTGPWPPFSFCEVHR